MIPFAFPQLAACWTDLIRKANGLHSWAQHMINVVGQWAAHESVLKRSVKFRDSDFIALGWPEIGILQSSCVHPLGGLNSFSSHQ